MFRKYQIYIQTSHSAPKPVHRLIILLDINLLLFKYKGFLITRILNIVHTFTCYNSNIL